MQLERTAETAVETQAGLRADEESAFTQLARLAIPAGLGDQAPLIAEGVDAIAISSAGERPLAAERRSARRPRAREHRRVRAGDPVGDRGARRRRRRARPRAERPHRDRPQPRPGLGPGGARPGAAPAGGGGRGRRLRPGDARAARDRRRARPGWRRAACRSSARWRSSTRLVAVGLVPSPDFPFDPGLYPTGARAAIALALVLLAARERRSRPCASARPRRGRAAAAAAPALGAVASAACLAALARQPLPGAAARGPRRTHGCWRPASATAGAPGAGHAGAVAACVPGARRRRRRRAASSTSAATPPGRSP